MVVSTRSSTRSGEPPKSQPGGHAGSHDSSIKAGVKGCGTVTPEKTSNDSISKFEDNFGDAMDNWDNRDGAKSLPGDSNGSGGCTSSVKELKDADDSEASSVWEGFSDISDREPAENRESESEWEGFDDSDSEWEGISDFPEDQKPHILILNRLLEDLNQTPTPIQASRGVIRYDVFINKSGGTATVRDRVLAKSDSNLLNLLETGDLSIDTLKELKAKNPKIGYRPGIYVHVIYKSDNLNDAGLYVGSAIVLAERVKKHKKDQKGFQKRSRLGARKRKTKARSQSLHQKFGPGKGTGTSGFV